MGIALNFLLAELFLHVPASISVVARISLDEFPVNCYDARPARGRETDTASTYLGRR